MTLRDALRTLGWLAGTLFPQQAVRVLVGRDYDAALGRVDDALAVAEERSEVLEPSDFPLCNCESTQAADLDDHRPACAARAADSPAVGERTPDNRPTAGRTPDPRVFDRDAYMAGLTWPEPKADVEQRKPGCPNVGRLCNCTGACLPRPHVGDGSFIAAPASGLDRHTQIQHVAAIIRGDNLAGVDAVATARRIVDMLAADKRIAERLDGAK